MGPVIRPPLQVLDTLGLHMPRGKPTPEPDEEEAPIPVEPAGAGLTELRKRQLAGRQAAEKLWLEITHNIQKAQEKPNGH